MLSGNLQKFTTSMDNYYIQMSARRFLCKFILHVVARPTSLSLHQPDDHARGHFVLCENRALESPGGNSTTLMRAGAIPRLYYSLDYSLKRKRGLNYNN
jgi:hypothetical protein